MNSIKNVFTNGGLLTELHFPQQREKWYLCKIDGINMHIFSNHRLVGNFLFFIIISIANFSAFALEGEKVYELTSKSIVVIKVEGGLGSGVLITKTLIATNCHVVKASKSINIEFFNERSAGCIIARNDQNDICVVELEKPLPNAIPVGGFRAWNSLKQGETVYTLGAPKSFKYTFSAGIISQKREHLGGKVIQFDASISPGNSGGGLFDRDGKLIGLPSFAIDVSKNAQNLNFAWSVDVFPEPLKSAMKSYAKSSSGKIPSSVDGRVDSGNKAEYAKLWKSAFDNSEWKSSLTLAEKWTSRAPANPDAWVARGRSSDKIQLGLGLPYFLKAHELRGNHQDALYYGALTARAIGNNNEYRRLFELLKLRSPSRAASL
jgi:Trypsin-like peptidase domain